MGISIKVEATPGDEIENTIRDMGRLADSLNCCVTIKFNDMLFWVYPNDDIALRVENARRKLLLID